MTCSGCVTTAETILQQEQSIEEFLNKAKVKEHFYIALSPQSRVSLAFHFKISESELHRALEKFFFENF